MLKISSLLMCLYIQPVNIIVIYCIHISVSYIQRGGIPLLLEFSSTMQQHELFNTPSSEGLNLKSLVVEHTPIPLRSRNAFEMINFPLH